MKQSKRDKIQERRSYQCGTMDGENTCRGVVVCGRCGYCLIHCECLATAQVEPGAGTLAGQQLDLCAKPRLEWRR